MNANLSQTLIKGKGKGQFPTHMRTLYYPDAKTKVTTRKENYGSISQ